MPEIALMVLTLGAALFAGNGYALFQARRGKRPAGAEGELRRGRAWFLAAVGLGLFCWGLGALVLS